MIKPENDRQATARDRARVAAELLEEARFLTDTGEIPIPAPNGPANGNGHGNGNGNGHHSNGNGNGKRISYPAARPSLSDTDRLAALDGAVAAQPESVPVLVDRAKQLGAMGRYTAARADLERALVLEPANLAVRTTLGIVLLRKGLWADAVPHLREVVDAESWSPTAWFYLGEALNHIDDLEGALAAYVRAAELDPRHAKALHAQGMVLDRLHRPEEAALLYRRSREAAAR
ncbi:MAG TPA: tetratricopeptide repeat protein [Gemmatimonadales bacterium]|jgi:tetratricopeptide (TPR) repeat protein|nr:tetratricopeptide repeat protein [Gemmatimonadales bacterium]